MTRHHTLGYALMGLGLVGSLWFYFWFQGVREQDCYDRGGVALVSLRDNICVDADGKVVR